MAMKGPRFMDLLKICRDLPVWCEAKKRPINA